MKLSEFEKKELLNRIKEEWEKHPHWTFVCLMSEMNYLAVGHTDIAESNDRALLKIFRRGWNKQ